jgi:hypothetical protein
MGTISFTTLLWKRSEASFATTIPKEILAIKGVDTDADVEVNWSINQDTGAVEASFEEAEGDD